MSYEKCPQCGKEKRKLVACAHCGFAFRPEIPKPYVAQLSAASRQAMNNLPETGSVEQCPQCGGEKKRLVACPHCGFTKAPRPTLRIRKPPQE